MMLTFYNCSVGRDICQSYFYNENFPFFDVFFQKIKIIEINYFLIQILI